jgi:hypothetical protein
MLLLSIVFFKITSEDTLGINDRLIVGIIFIICCLVGISLAIYPGWIKRKLGGAIKDSDKKNNEKSARKRIGHHPDCDRFRSHKIRIKDNVYCAGCLGLAIGCLISIILMSMYVTFSFSLSSDFFLFLTIFGFFIIGFVFIEILVNNKNILTHIISNSLLVLSFLIIIIGITELTRNISFGIICIVLTLLWMDTRIQLSKWHHSKICYKCVKSCKMY